MKQLSLLVLFFGFTGAFAQKQIILYDNCELMPVINWEGNAGNWQYFQGNIKPKDTGLINSGTSKLQVSDSFSRKGKYSYRFSIQKDTTYGATGLTATTRSELAWNITSNNVKTGVRWVAASILIPTWFADDVTPDGVLFCAIPVPYDHPTPSFMYIMKGHWYFEGIVISDSATHTGKFLYDLGPVDKGVWTDWIMNRNFTQNDSGYIKLYKNGKLVLNHTGGNWIEKGHYAEMYMPLGIYKWPWNDSTGEGRGPSLVNDQRVVYYDEIRFGNTAAKLEDFVIVPDSSKNLPPIVDAGSTITIIPPKNAATLRGSAHDSDGVISKIEWSRLSGDTSVKIVDNAQLSTTVLNLKQGTYKFRLSVSDNTGFVTNDEVQVVVTAPQPDVSDNIFFYDKCEDEPEIQPLSEWAQLPLSRWSFYTGIGNDVYNKNEKTSITVSSDFARKGKKSYKVSVTKNPTYKPVSMRAELSWNQPATKFVGFNWMSASLLIPKTWVDDCTPVSVLFSTKATPDNYATPFRLEILKDRMHVVVVNILPDGKVKGEIVNDIGPVIKGEWTDWAVNRNFTQADSGYIKLYKNGVLVWEHHGPNWLNGTGRSPEAYVLQGLYKWTWSDSTGMGWGYPCYNGTIEAYYDEFKFGKYGSKLSDFVILDSGAVTKPPAISSPGTPVVFDRLTGHLVQSPMGVWGSKGAGTLAMSSGQFLNGNGFVEMMFTDTVGYSGVLCLDNDSSLHEVKYKDSTREDDLIWIARAGGKFLIGDYIKGKQVIKTIDSSVVPLSLVRIKRVGTAFIAQTYNSISGWINLYTFEYRTSEKMWIKSEFNEGNIIMYPVLGN